MTSIQFYDKKAFSSEAFQKPFKNFEYVEIAWCRLVGNILPKFVDLFPRLRHLEIFNFIRGTVDKTISLNVSFPHLKHLLLGIWEMGSNSLFVAAAVALLQANPHLQSLEINSYDGLELRTFLNAIKTNPSIAKMKIECKCVSIFDITMDELNCVAVEHPSIVELILPIYRFNAADAIKFIGLMKSLKQMEFQVSDCIECDQFIASIGHRMAIQCFDC